MNCGMQYCQRPATNVLNGMHICSTCFRKLTTGEFGEKLNPPWTRQQALDALINQDGLDPDVAAKRIEQHFGTEPSKM